MSHQVVRILYNEVRLFPTRQRAPFLLIFETVAPAESMKREPAFERDFDYLRCKYNILTPDKIASDIREDISSTKARENLSFTELKTYLAREKDLLDKNLNEVRFEGVRRPPGRSASAHCGRRPRAPKTRNMEFMNVRKLQKMSEAEVRARMAFVLTLLKSCTSKGFVKLNIEYLEKLKEVLSLMIRRKQQKQAMRQAGAVGGVPASAFLEKARQIQRESPYGGFASYRLRAYIVKSGDDMRQEALLLHFKSLLRDIFLAEKVQVFLMDLDFILLSKSSAMIEFIPDSNSVSGLKKLYPGQSLASIFRLLFSANFHEAQKNFVESMAGYALFCYLFQVKDRHNSNILVDSVGHLVHIDFGFCLAVSPGNFAFETAPFKFTAEHLELMGGSEDYMFYYFRSLLFKAFEVLKKHVQTFASLVEVMRLAELPCFHRFDVRAFESRFHPYFTDQQRWDLVDRLLGEALYSRRTALYDQFQKYSNDIEY